MMNQERCCASDVIAQTTIVFVTSINDRAQNVNQKTHHQSGSSSFILYDSLPASALDNVVTFACDDLFENTRRAYQANLKNFIHLNE